MKTLLEAFNIPKRILSMIGLNDIRREFEDQDLSKIECVQLKNTDELQQYYDADAKILLIGMYDGEIFFRMMDKKSERNRSEQLNIFKKGFIDAYAFVNVNSLNDIHLQRKFNQEGERHNTKNMNKMHFTYNKNNDDNSNPSYTGYRSTYDRKRMVIDRSGYEIDFERYIKKLNDIKRISGNFEKKLLALQNQYIDLLEEIYRTEITARRQAVNVKYKLDSYTVSDIKKTIERDLSDIVSKYETYVNNKKFYIKYKEKYELEPNNNNKADVEQTKQLLEKNERDITNTLKYMEERLKELKDQWYEENGNRAEVEESVRTFKKVFEAVGSPKLIFESGDYKIYTKPFSKVTIQSLSKVDRWGVPTKFSNYNYLLINTTQEGYLLFGDKDYDYDERNFGWGHTKEIIGVLNEFFSTYNFEDFVYQKYCNRYPNFVVPYIDTKEKALIVLSGNYQTRSIAEELIQEKILEKFKFTKEDILDIISHAGEKVLKTMNEQGFITPQIIASLKIDNPNSYNSSASELFRDVLSDEQIKKAIKIMNPIENKNLLLYLLTMVEVGQYMTDEQIISLFRQRINMKDIRGYCLKDNIREILKNHKLPRDVVNKLLLMGNEDINIIKSKTFSTNDFKDMSNMDADKIYRLLLISSDAVKKAISDGMDIPEYMQDPIRRSLKLQGKNSLLQKFNSIYSK